MRQWHDLQNLPPTTGADRVGEQQRTHEVRRIFEGGEQDPAGANPRPGSHEIEIATTTGFGYTRIIGELRKLGIKGISRQTVRNILKEEDIQPGPDRTSDCWDNFVKRHAETLWAVDFFSVKTVTVNGLRDMYLMAFLCLSSREVIVSSSTEHPNSAWVVEQTKVFLDQTTNREQKPSIVMHDRDTKFTKDFKAILKAKDVRTNALTEIRDDVLPEVRTCLDPETQSEDE